MKSLKFKPQYHASYCQVLEFFLIDHKLIGTQRYFYPFLFIYNANFYQALQLEIQSNLVYLFRE